MFEKILFPTSGSGLSVKIAEVIVGLVREKPDRKVYILNVVDQYSMPPEVDYEMERTGLSADTILKRNVEESIQKAIRVFEDNDIPYKVKIRRGKPVPTIVKTAMELNCNLMIIGYHGECTITEFIFKDNIMSCLIDQSHCPVLVVK